MRNVSLKLYDELAEINVDRVIYISNLMVNNTSAPIGWESNVLGNEDQQRKGIENWINERGNDQHDTILSLISWSIN